VSREKIFLLTLGLTGFASSLAQRSTDPMVTAIAADFAAPIATVAMLSTSYALPYGLCQPLLGPLGDVIGKSAVLKVCVALFAVALALGAMATSLDWLFASRVIAGIAAGGVIPLALAMIGDRFEMAGRQVAISRFLSAAIIGQIVGVTSAGVLAETIGWRGAVWATSGAAAIAAIGAFVGLKPNQRTTSAISGSPRHSAAMASSSPIRVPPSATAGCSRKASPATAFRPTSPRCWRRPEPAARPRRASSSPASALAV
jgi:predicted MFS family arabinose efflux permease